MLKVITRLVYLLLYSALCALPGSAFAAAGETSRPNILLLVADDLGYNDSAIYQDIYHQQPVAAMPALESLAQQGVRFTRFYTESTCSASRVALLTGQYPARQGFMPVGRGISPDVITLPEFLRAHGYATHLVGKWHMGEINQEAFPDRQGFDTSFGFLNQWMLKGPDAQGHVQLKSPTYISPWLRDDNAITHTQSYKQYQGHLEDILTERTVSLIKNKNSKQQPWFIYHAFFAPHTPLEPAARFAERFDNTPDGKYKALLAQLDDSVLQILSALKETGQWDNTIVVFLSDNGSSRGKVASEKHGNSNAPFIGGKAEYEEGGIRTPLLIKWQKDLTQQASATRSEVVSIMDIYPSLVAAVESKTKDKTAALKNLDGIASLLSVNPQQRNTPLYFLTYGSLSVLSADGNQRLLCEWDAGSFTQTQVFDYNKAGTPVAEHSSWFNNWCKSNNKSADKLFEKFVQWRNQIRNVPLHIEKSMITGSDFLRAPLNPSWSVAFAFNANDVNKNQQLLFQKDLLDVVLDKGELHATVNGLNVNAKGIQPGVCYRVVLSGEFYDRYSNIQGGVRASNLHLIVNGKEVDSATASLENFEKVDISAPTITGNITKPKIFLTQLLPNDKPIPSGFDEAINACP